MRPLIQQERWGEGRARRGPRRGQRAGDLRVGGDFQRADALAMQVGREAFEVAHRDPPHEFGLRAQQAAQLEVQRRRKGPGEGREQDAGIGAAAGQMRGAVQAMRSPLACWRTPADLRLSSMAVR